MILGKPDEGESALQVVGRAFVVVFLSARARFRSILPS